MGITHASWRTPRRTWGDCYYFAAYVVLYELHDLSYSAVIITPNDLDNSGWVTDAFPQMFMGDFLNAHKLPEVKDKLEKLVRAEMGAVLARGRVEQMSSSESGGISPDGGDAAKELAQQLRTEQGKQITASNQEPGTVVTVDFYKAEASGSRMPAAISCGDDEEGEGQEYLSEILQDCDQVFEETGIDETVKALTVSKSDPEIFNYWKLLTLQANHLILIYWEAIEKVAKALYQHHELSAEQVGQAMIGDL